MTFETVNEATRLWIKGQDFSVARLLGVTYKGQAENYNGSALAIFRLAPQDYHRFHSPVDGKIGPMTYISGEYYTDSDIRVITSKYYQMPKMKRVTPKQDVVSGEQGKTEADLETRLGKSNLTNR